MTISSASVVKIVLGGCAVALVLLIGLLRGSRQAGVDLEQRVGEGPPFDSLSLLEPVSLEDLPRPYVRVLVRVVSPGARLVSVSANGVPFAKSDDQHRSIDPVPLHRDGGWLKFAVKLQHGPSTKQTTYCWRYSCKIEGTHDEQMLAMLRDVESPIDTAASGALLALVECVDHDYVDYVCARLASSGDPRARRRMAMLLGRWRAPEATAGLLRVLRADESNEVRRACMQALCAIGPLDGPSPPSRTVSTRVEPGVDRELEQWLAPLLPRLRAERFPSSCEVAR